MLKKLQIMKKEALTRHSYLLTRASGKILQCDISPMIFHFFANCKHYSLTGCSLVYHMEKLLN